MAGYGSFATASAVSKPGHVRNAASPYKESRSEPSFDEKATPADNGIYLSISWRASSHSTPLPRG